MNPLKLKSESPLLATHQLFNTQCEQKLLKRPEKQQQTKKNTSSS